MPKGPGETFENLKPHLVAQPAGEGTFGAAGETNQALGKFGKVFGGCCGALARLRILRARTQFHAGNEAAQVLIARPIAYQQGIAGAAGGGDLSPYMRLEPGLIRRLMEARRAVDAVNIGERHSALAVPGCNGCIVFRSGGTPQKAERRTGMQFNVGSRHFVYCGGACFSVSLIRDVWPTSTVSLVPSA